MIRRLFVWSCLLGWAIFAWPRAVEAQGCYPGNTPTLAISSVQILDPKTAASQGYTTGTVNVQSTNVLDSHGNNLGEKSHKATYTPGTQVVFTFSSSANTTVGNLFYTVDSDPTQHYWSANLNGTYGITWQASNVGHIYHVVFGASDNPNGASQDRDDVTIVAGSSPSIVYQDGNDSNIIYVISSTYSGVPQISFADCPSMRTAHHTPTATLQLQNGSSGEIHNTVSVSGPAVLAGNSVQAGAVDVISALVGDTVTGSYGGVTFCDVDNINFFGLQSLFRIEGAKVVVADLGHPPRVGSEKPVPSAIYDVAPICQNNCDPPDWQPTVVHSWAGRHPYWIGECQLLRAPDVDGVTWIPLCSFLTDASGAFGAGLVPSTIQLAAGGLALPYPGPAPLLPIPGKCTKYPINVLFTVGPNDLKNWFENIPN